MFIGFKLEIGEDFLSSKNYDDGLSYYAGKKKQIQQELEEFIYKRDVIDGDLLKDAWFPEVKTDVFISHSHLDEKMAISLAGWLWINFGIEAFIDSSIWGYSDDLVKLLDNKYSFQETINGVNHYSYNKCLLTSSHVHMMLSTALQNTIDKAECILFLDTPNSMEKDAVINGYSTYSPWIYSELVTSKNIRHKPLSKYRIQHILENRGYFNAEQNALKISYNAPVNQLVPLNDSDLEQWKKHNAVNYLDIGLDLLYQIKNKDILKAMEAQYE